MNIETLEMALETMRLSCVIAAFYKPLEWWPVVTGKEAPDHQPRALAICGILFALVVIAAGLPGVLMQQVTWMTPQQVLQKEGALLAWSLMLVVMAVLSFMRAQRASYIAGAYAVLVMAAGWAAWTAPA